MGVELSVYNFAFFIKVIFNEIAIIPLPMEWQLLNLSSLHFWTFSAVSNFIQRNNFISELGPHKFEGKPFLGFYKYLRQQYATWCISCSLQLYITDYYIYICTITLLLLTMCLILVNGSIFWNATFYKYCNIWPISTGPMDQFFI